jgi:hypothetical protein
MTISKCWKIPYIAQYQKSIKIQTFYQSIPLKNIEKCIIQYINKYWKSIWLLKNIFLIEKY